MVGFAFLFNFSDLSNEKLSRGKDRCKRVNLVNTKKEV